MLFLLWLALSYVGAGVLFEYTVAQVRKDPFDFEWTEILKWPANLFQLAQANKPTP